MGQITSPAQQEAVNKLKAANVHISPALVRQALDYNPISVGSVCSSPNIEQWSEYKPINYSGETLPASVRSTATGFIIDGLTQHLVYDKPKGGASSPYRLADFRQYRHDARPPQNTKINQDTFQYNEATPWGPSEAIFSIPIVLPNTYVVQRWKNEAATYADTVSVYDASGVVLPDDEGIGGKARYSLAPYTESYTTVWFSVKVDLSNVHTGMQYSFTFQIWYGSSVTENWKRFRLTGGDTITITGKVVPLSVMMNVGVLPLWHFPPLTVNNYDTAVTYSYNASTKQLSITNMRLEGDMSAGATSSDISNFEMGLDWKYQYQIFDKNYNQVKGWTDMALSVWGTGNAPAGTYVAGAYFTGAYVISNVEYGYMITIRAVGGNTYNY